MRHYVLRLSALILLLSLTMTLTGCSATGKPMLEVSRHRPSSEFLECLRTEYKESRHGDCTKAALKVYITQNMPKEAIR